MAIRTGRNDREADPLTYWREIRENALTWHALSTFGPLKCRRNGCVGPLERRILTSVEQSRGAVLSG
jgi:hypothetical protein